jgi:hypothetical protein
MSLSRGLGLGQRLRTLLSASPLRAAPALRRLATSSPLRRLPLSARAAAAAAPSPSPAPPRRALATASQHRLRPASPAHDHAPICVADHYTVTAPHARLTAQGPEDYMLAHAVYTREEVEALRTDVHFAPRGLGDRAALAAITLIRSSFDLLSGYSHAPGAMSEDKYLTRAIFLETVAGVPGMVASMVRHFESLRLMRRDNGWIHSLLAEAENERMHLLTFLELKQPGPLMRAAVLVTQGVFFNAFFAAYLLAPSLCHRFVGFLEEEAVRTYTRVIEDLDAGRLPAWSALAAPPIAVKYWRLPEGAMMRDVLLAVRADEAIHRDANHVFASLDKAAANPFAPK